MLFEWDADKNETNKREHGISFDTAKFVFNDPHRIEYYDEKNSSMSEDRYITLGLVENVLFVSFVERGDAIRLISARVANKKERRLYNEYNQTRT